MRYYLTDEFGTLGTVSIQQDWDADYLKATKHAQDLLRAPKEVEVYERKLNLKAYLLEERDLLAEQDLNVLEGQDLEELVMETAPTRDVLRALKYHVPDPLPVWKWRSGQPDLTPIPPGFVLTRTNTRRRKTNTRLAKLARKLANA